MTRRSVSEVSPHVNDGEPQIGAFAPLVHVQGLEGLRPSLTVGGMRVAGRTRDASRFEFLEPVPGSGKVLPTTLEAPPLLHNFRVVDGSVEMVLGRKLVVRRQPGDKRHLFVVTTGLPDDYDAGETLLVTKLREGVRITRHGYRADDGAFDRLIGYSDPLPMGEAPAKRERHFDHLRWARSDRTIGDTGVRRRSKDVFNGAPGGIIWIFGVFDTVDRYHIDDSGNLVHDQITPQQARAAREQFESDEDAREAKEAAEAATGSPSSPDGTPPSET